MAEDRETKADRYLTEGRVKVREAGPSAGKFEVSGSDVYRVTFQGGVWSCNCPARVTHCTHILACQKIASFSTVTDLAAGSEGLDPQLRFLDDLFR